jgi:hypothetical protein
VPTGDGLLPPTLIGAVACQHSTQRCSLETHCCINSIGAGMLSWWLTTLVDGDHSFGYSAAEDERPDICFDFAWRIVISPGLPEAQKLVFPC